MDILQKIGTIVKAVVTRVCNRKTSFASLGLMIGVLTAACTGASNSSQQSTTAPPTIQQEAAADVATEESTTSAEAANPMGLEEFGLSMEQLVTHIEAVEAHIAKCMNDAGFEYVAVDFNTVRRGMLADKALPGLVQREFKAQYGFGISTLYADVDVPQRAPEYVPARIGLGEKNVQIFNNLSPADQVAYNRTLLGENLDATFTVTIEAQDFSRTGGCTRAAVEQVFTPEELSASYKNPADVLEEQNPRMVAALEQYAECVRAAGYSYDNPEDIEPDIEERFEEITGGVTLGKLSADAKAALTDLQAEERAIAVASFDCEHKFIHPIQDVLEGRAQDQQ